MNDPIDDDFTSIGIPRTSTAASGSNARPAAPSAARTAPALDRGGTTTPQQGGVVQPKPQALPKRTGPSSIIVSPRQKGNPLLNGIKQVPWEYGDIVPDYILGATTLKYHRLHPEYIYTRIKQLQGKYNLRLVLVMVDIDNHEDPLKELSKTSLINNVTLMLCWSAVEGGRYLELFKTYENAPATSIKQHQSTTYSDRMVDFITTPRSINKTDAVSLVSQFGSIRTAVNARHEDISGIAGWGEKKVQRWVAAVHEPFRIQRAARRGLGRENTLGTQPVSLAPALLRDASLADEPAAPGLGKSILTSRLASKADALPDGDADQRPGSRLAEHVNASELDVADDAIKQVTIATANAAEQSKVAEIPETSSKKRKVDEDAVGDGVMAALAKLRNS
ncbi:ssDNA endonuclease and repair protein rad10 [Oleoguttula sp. CCFEE 5521]